jgi:hypothetical protein
LDYVGLDKRVQHFANTAIRIAERDGLFQKIVTTTVTKKPDINNLQTQIGDATNLSESTSWTCFGNNKRMTIAQRAPLLCAKMKEL